MKGYKPKFLRQKNYASILNLCKANRYLTVTDIQQHVDLSKTTISNIVNLLVERNVLKSVGKGLSSSEGGKRPMIYELNAEYAYCISVMVSDCWCSLRIYDMHLNVVAHNVVDYDKNTTYENVLEIVAEQVRASLHRALIPPAQLYGIAYHCKGIVDSKSGILVHPRVPSWHRSATIRDDLAVALGYDVPIYVDNSSRFAGYSELLNPDNQRIASLLIINISISPNENYEGGIGGCLIIDGQMNPRPRDFLSEIGHLIINIDSAVRCKCGSYGCLESYIDSACISHMVSKLAPDYPDSSLGVTQTEFPITLYTLLYHARNGDALACRVAETVINAFSVLLHNLVLTCGSDRIIFQSLEKDGLIGYFVDQIRSKFASQKFFELEDDKLDIVCSFANFELQANLGAASFCRDRSMEALMAGIVSVP